MKEYIQASSKDTDVILDIVQSSIKNVYPKYYLKEVVEFFCDLHCRDNIFKDIEDGLVGMLMVDGVYVGTGCYRDNHITRVYVKPEYQGKGYGSYIMDCLEEIISKKYVKAILDASLPASHLYEKRGYVTIEHCRHAVGNRVVLVYEVMEKLLTKNTTRINYSDKKLFIRSMEVDDAKIIYETYLSYGWNPSLETYQNYYKEQKENKRKVFIAEYERKVSGLCTLVMNPTEGPWGNMGYPEIVDLTVFFHVHNKGIGNKLLDFAEREAAKVADMVYLAVGIHSGYGAAQRIYVKRGYIPDGSGVWYKGKQLDQYAPCCNDDDLLLFMSKKLDFVGDEKSWIFNRKVK